MSLIFRFFEDLIGLDSGASSHSLIRVCVMITWQHVRPIWRERKTRGGKIPQGFQVSGSLLGGHGPIFSTLEGHGPHAFCLDGSQIIGSYDHFLLHMPPSF